MIPLAVLGFLYQDALTYLVHIWSTDENYGHGFLIPAISLYLMWERREHLVAIPRDGSWWGVVVVGAGLTFYLLGNLRPCMSFFTFQCGLSLWDFSWLSSASGISQS